MTARSVAVVIPVFNAERLLAEAIDSVLAQTNVPDQVIVVDDGSTDGSAEVARAFVPAVTLVQQANGGAGAARNAGVALATTDLLAFLDADDTWPHEKMEHQVAAFAADADLDIVFGHAQPFLDDDATPGVRAAAKLAVIPGYVPGAMLVRLESFLRVGPFRTDVRLGEFIDWYARAEQLGLRSAMLPEVVLRRRLHAANSGLRERDRRSDYLAVVRQSLQARRASNGGPG